LFFRLGQSQVESDIDFEVVNSYTTDLSSINNIITVDDKSTWVNDWGKQVIRQINIDNDNITTTKQISCYIYDMTLTSIFLDFVAVVNIVLPWIDFKAAMISSWWSIIVFSAWSVCLFKSQNVFLTVFLSNIFHFAVFENV
jgi:hypothetical protein